MKIFSQRGAAFFFGLICLGTACFSFYHSVQKNFSLDETDLAIRAHMINSDGPRGPEKFYGTGNGEAVPHPPMYDYTLALLFRLFGETEATARGFGILCFALVGALMALTLRYLLEEETPFLQYGAIFTALCLYLVNPLIIQHSMLVDADAAFTFLFLNLFIFFFVRFEKDCPEEYGWPRLKLAFIFALVCLSKEGTPFLAAGGVLFYRLLGREWKKMGADFFLVFILGTMMAWSAWLVFCHFTGIDAMIFLRQQYAFRAHRLSQASLLITALKKADVIIRWPLFWASPAFFILLTVCLFERSRQFFNRHKPGLIDICFCVGIAVWVPYFFIRPSIDMMKYQHPVYPLFILIIVCGLVRIFSPHLSHWRRILENKSWVSFLLIFLAAFTCFYYYKLGDSIIFLSYPDHDNQRLCFIASYWYPMGWVMAGGLVCSLLFRKFFKEILVLVCLFFIFPVSIALDLRQTAPYTTAESWLNYGEAGLKETVDYLAVRLSPQTPTILRKDLVYYLKLRRGINLSKNKDPLYLFRDKALPEAVHDYRMDVPPSFAVLDPIVTTANPLLRILEQKIFEHYTLAKKFGSFVILRHSGYSPEEIAAP